MSKINRKRSRVVEKVEEEAEDGSLSSCSKKSRQNMTMEEVKTTASSRTTLTRPYFALVRSVSGREEGCAIQKNWKMEWHAQEARSWML